ncbi:MAG: hypothetical protein LIO94_13280, partial [Clostridiales bacterium]|nr:hypothetical protein [Clostridiales bacterium]
MKKRYICNGVIVVLAVLILVSMVFCYVTINPEQFSGTEKEFLEYVISGVDAYAQLSFSAITMIQGI